MSTRISTAAFCLGALLAASVAIAGCSPGGDENALDGPVSVYMSTPTSGPTAADGQDAANGAQLAQTEALKAGDEGKLPIKLTVLDGAKGGTEVAAAANARTAVQDSGTGAYIGELDSAATRNSLPITNDAGIAQISPTAGAVDLTGEDPLFEDSPDRYQPSTNATFARIVPTDAQVTDAQAKAPSGEKFTALVDPSELPASAKSFLEAYRAEFHTEPGPYAAYGYEAMQIAIQSIEASTGKANGFRGRVVDQVLSATRADSPLGDYGITEGGDSTLCLVQPLRGTTALKPVCADPSVP